VVDRVSDVLTPAPFDAPELGSLVREAKDASALRLSPDRHGTDGFFVQSLVRR
jgi:16S rRNA C967 or C1407 C5-methylase (RsmB/RsmF family)